MGFSNRKAILSGAVGLALMSTALVPQTATAAGAFGVSEFEWHGYVREYLSFNLNDQSFSPQDDAFDPSMIRTQIRIDPRWRIGPFLFFTSFRASIEAKTAFLSRLENGIRGNNAFAAEVAGFNITQDLYDKFEAREFYMEYESGRFTARLGRQQLVWGETDFFQAADMVHGFDFTWRSFLEPENEELRKPLIMANFYIQVPESNGAINFWIRPGLDRDKDIGISFDLDGGRWAPQGNRGLSFFGVSPFFGPLPLTTKDVSHPGADVDEVTGGIRWSGMTGDLNYSIQYLHHHNPEPVLNPSAFVSTRAFGTFGVPIRPNTPFKGVNGGGVLGGLIFPLVNTIAGTASYYSQSTDIVFSFEGALTFDKPYNAGVGNPVLAGADRIAEKNTLRLMFRLDKPLNLTNIIGTSRPSFFTIQVFDTWVPNLKKSDSIVSLVGFTGLKSKHSALATMILAMNYNNDLINPTLVAGWDLSYGGGFLVPSIQFQIGDAWRIKLEADLFFGAGDGPNQAGAQLFDYFDDQDQFLIRTTYQF